MKAPQSTTTVIIQWTGPFTLEELKGRDEKMGIYLLTGRKNRSKAENNELQYCGITEQQFCKRVNASHDKVKEISKKTLQIWIGCLRYPQEQVRKHLEDIEAAFVSFWDVKMNSRKKKYYPDFPVCIISRWCRPNGTAYKNFPAELNFIRDLEDVLWWDTEDWRVGNLWVQKFEFD